MFKGRTFKNDFAIELNDIFDSPDGIYFETLRLKQFINTINNKIIDDNDIIISELQKEDPDVYLSMIQQPNIDCSLNYFQNILLRSIFITSYTALEHRLRDICIVCSKHKKDKDYLRYRKTHSHSSDLIAPKEFLETELHLDLGDLNAFWVSLKDYHKLRKLIIHGHSEIEVVKLTKLIESKFSKQLLENNGNDWNKLFVLEFIDKSYYLLDSLIQLLNTEYNLVSYD